MSIVNGNQWCIYKQKWLDPGREAKVQINGLLFSCCPIKQTNKKITIFFSQIYHCEPPPPSKHSTVVRHSGTIVPFLAELSQTQNKIRAFFPTVTSHTQIFWRIFLNLWRIMMEIWERARSLCNLPFFAFKDIKVDKNGRKAPN